MNTHLEKWGDRRRKSNSFTSLLNKAAFSVRLISNILLAVFRFLSLFGGFLLRSRGSTAPFSLLEMGVSPVKKKKEKWTD